MDSFIDCLFCFSGFMDARYIPIWAVWMDAQPLPEKAVVLFCCGGIGRCGILMII